MRAKGSESEKREVRRERWRDGESERGAEVGQFGRRVYIRSVFSELGSRICPFGVVRPTVSNSSLCAWFGP